MIVNHSWISICCINLDEINQTLTLIPISKLDTSFLSTVCLCKYNSGTTSFPFSWLASTDMLLLFIIYFLQDPNEDTEWNDILRKKGILPPKEEPKDNEEEELVLQQQSVGKRRFVKITIFYSGAFRTFQIRSIKKYCLF